MGLENVLSLSFFNPVAKAFRFFYKEKFQTKIQ